VPSFVLVAKSQLYFEGFHKAIRTPLVFDEVVESYVPFESAGGFQVARRRGGGEPPALSSWREILGSEVDLGLLGAASSVDRLSACSPRPGTTCLEFLRLHVPPSEELGRHVDIAFLVGGLSYRVRVHLVRGRAEYAVNLSRLWFWSVARRRGITAEVLPQGPIAEMEIVARRGDRPVLY
jgi:hypothetical protein